MGYSYVSKKYITLDCIYFEVVADLSLFKTKLHMTDS